MTSSHTPAPRCQWFSTLATVLDPRSAPRLAALLLGVILAHGRKTLSCWIRVAGLSDQYRRCYATAAALGCRTERLATRVLLTLLKPLVADTPRVVLALVVTHPLGGIVALPLLAQLYIREKNLGAIAAKNRPAFATKLAMAVELVRWAHGWLSLWGKAVWVVADGAYAKAPVLKPLRVLGVTVVSRLRKDAALWSVPPTPGAKRRGRPRIYGQQRLSLAKRAGQKGGWITETFTLYGKAVEKRYKSFVATWRPAGGAIRVVLVDEPSGWVAFFCTDPSAAVADILGRVADRFSLEKTQADYPQSRRWVGTRGIGYHRRDGVARTGRLVPAATRQPRRSRPMSDTRRRTAPPRA